MKAFDVEINKRWRHDCSGLDAAITVLNAMEQLSENKLLIIKIERTT